MNKTILSLLAKTIRGLSIDAIEAAGCGHPGLPLGCAEIGAYLYASALKHNPNNANWMNRDRFILSAGHGSMLLYSCLHLSGYPLSLNDLKRFRQLGSPTAGHPEYGEAAGIETTTGPLGQGIATACGMALGNKIASEKITDENGSLIDGTIYTLAGDGCLMEGISAEASSLAGHLNLDNLVIIYDSNAICLDGPTEECFTETVQKRYESYGFNVVEINGHDFDELDRALNPEKRPKGKPLLVIAKTTIGFGSPNRAGTSESHGKALGESETKLTKDMLGIPTEPLFYIPNELQHFFKERNLLLEQKESKWQARFTKWKQNNPKQSQLIQAAVEKQAEHELEQHIKRLEIKPNLATRASSQAVIQELVSQCDYIIGGSADLSCSDSTGIKGSGIIQAGQFSEKNIKYGVREFAMGAMASGLALQGLFKPFIGTFLTFSDYMRNAIRLACLMNLPVVYQFTHDSILLGEDGPTHQPVEHLASLRATPNLTVIRPGDVVEVKAAWWHAMTAKNPVALILSRQGTPDLDESCFEGTQKGAYILKKESGNEDYCLLATGTELALALEVANRLESEGHSTRVVSFPSFELFEEQSSQYQNEILGTAQIYCSIEAQSELGWHKYIGKEGVAISVNQFGKSAPAAELKEVYGFTCEAIVKKLQEARVETSV